MDKISYAYKHKKLLLVYRNYNSGELLDQEQKTLEGQKYGTCPQQGLNKSKLVTNFGELENSKIMMKHLFRFILYAQLNP